MYHISLVKCVSLDKFECIVIFHDGCIDFKGIVVAMVFD